MATITGTANADTLTGTATADTISGLAGNDILNGGDGDDTLIGGAGADTLIGGAGIDIASYNTATAGVTVNLATGVNGGDAAGDTYDGIEIILGSGLGDSFVSGAAGDQLNASAGVDTISYVSSTAAVNVNLTTNVVSGGYAQGDILSNFESVIGSSFDDVLASGTQGQTLAGGLGDDTYVISAASVTIVEGASAGRDMVSTAIASFTLASIANVEDLIYTGSGNFTGTGNTLNNAITGGIGADNLSGGAGNDVLTGGDGNDTLIGGAGADTLIGGAGTDTVTYIGATVGVTVNLATGVNGGDATGDTYDGVEIIQGSGLDDSFVSGADANRVDGLAGTADTISYAASNAAVNVNLATNVVSGGYAEGDVISNFERVAGSVFDDTLADNVSGHYLMGGLGDDTYIVGNAGVIAYEVAGEGQDHVLTALTSLSLATYTNVEDLAYTGTANFNGTGNASNNIITGGVGADTLNGAAGADTLNGGDGADILIGGAGADALVGGAGTDTASYSGATAGVIVNLATGVNGGDAAGDTYDGIEIILGSGLDDTFVANGDANRLDGAVGTADTISYAASNGAVNVNLATNVVSGGGADGDVISNFERVIGSAFDDTLSDNVSGHYLMGGQGDDTYIVGNAGVVAYELAAEGVDRILTALTTFTLASINNVEDLTYTGTGNFSGTGNTLNNVITGGAGTDTLNGGAGADTLNGGDGNDTLIGGAGADTFVGGAGTDTVTYAGGAAVIVDLANGVGGGDAAGDTFDGVEIIVGSSNNDTFISSAAAERLDGAAGAVDTISYASSGSAVNVNLATNVVSGGGADGDVITNFERVIGSANDDVLASTVSGHTLEGGAGDDTYVIGNAGVVVTEAVGGGNDLITTGLTTFTLGTNLERLTYTGAAAFTGTGNSEANVITGGTGADTLNGATGDDTLYGGDGNDTLIGGGGADAFIGGAGTDTVTYAGAVTVNLATGVHTGEAAGDSFDGVEIIQGSVSNDIFVANADANRLDGSGGTGDTISYAASGSAVNVNLTTNVVSGGDAEGDVISNFERVIGSAFNDTLASTTSGHVLEGGAGDDTYVLTATGVTITEVAGGGFDTVQTNFASHVLAANLEGLTYTGTGAFTGTGNTADNIVTGGVGADTLDGAAGNDTLNGGGGDDRLIGGAGADALVGGDGVDTASYVSAVTINLSTGVHTGDAAGDTFDGIEIIQGSASADTFVSGAGADRLDGSGGIDTISYAGSAYGVTVNLTTNVVSGGDADGDTISNFERVIGSAFADTLTSTTSGHVLEGGAGDDTYVLTATGVSTIEAAGGGFDTLRTSFASQTLGANLEGLVYTGTANFTGTGNTADNAIAGGVGADTLDGGAGNDTLDGGDGNDLLIGGAGADALIGGGGTDTASYAAATRAVGINLLGEGSGDAAGDSYDGIEIFLGSGFADSFIGDGAGNTFNGGAGNDTINYSNSAAAVNVNLTTGAVSGGHAQGDVLISIEQVIGTGKADTLASATSGHVLAGGGGNDIYVVGATGVTITENAGEGDDTIQTALTSFTLSSANVENLAYTGSVAFSGTGSAGDNAITGGVGADTLSGAAGNDTLNGGDGDDVLIGGAGADALIGGAGTDTASYAGGSAVSINLVTGVHGGDAASDTFDGIEVFLGSANADTFVGNGEGNTFNGGNGVDTIDYSGSADAVDVNLTTGAVSGGDAQGDVLTAFERVIGSALDDTLASATSSHVLAGGAGDDTYIVGATGLVITENAGEGDDTVQTNLTSYTLGANIENLAYTGSAAFAGTGSAVDNTITGGTGVDTLNGAAGNDTLNGGDGDDILVGGAGADALVGGAGTDTASYAGGAAVSINLLSGVQGGDAAGDTFDGIEVFLGSSNADTFVGDDTGNSFIGGSGVDTIDYSASLEAVTIDLTTGVVWGGDAEGDVLTSIEKVIASALNDILTSATSGHALIGGGGNDTYVVGGSGVVITENADQGEDTVQTNLTSYTLSANIENLTYTGSAAFTGTGGADDNTITGGVGGDTLNGAAGDDWLDAGDGNDTLIGGAGADHLLGGAGTDTASYAGASGAVSINLLTGENGGDAAGDVFIDIEVFLGSSSADTFAGDDKGNTFNGGGGVDTIDYSGSLEAVNVNLTTGAVSGGDAQGDMLISVEKVIGSGADDILTSSTSGHVLAGGYGDDVYVVGSAGVVLLENEDDGVDIVQTNLASFTLGSANIENIVFTGSGAFAGTGSAGDNTITGGSSGDTLNGAAGNDTLNGGDGDDILIGGAGADHLVGGAGNDIARYAAAVIIDMLTGDHGGDAAGDTLDGIELIQGSASADTFISGEGADRFDGAGGTDTLSYAGSANAVNVNLTTNVVSGGDAQGDVVSNFEKVIGSSGDDILASSTNGHILAGGWGDDTYLVGASGVVVQEDADGGNDTIQVAVASFTLTTLNVENITYAGSGTFNGVGSGDANSITGGAGADTLSGGGGDDTLVGGDGNDVLVGGAGADHLVGGAGTDTASYADSLVGLSFDLDNGTISDIGEGDTFDSIERVLGSNKADVFLAGFDAHAIDGGGDIDFVSYAWAGSGLTIDMTNPGASTGYAAGDTFTSIEILQGSHNADTIIGDSSANVFIGGDGGDAIEGGGGADSVWYLLQGTSVTIDLSAGYNSAGDTLTNIEGIIGSTFADVITGDGGANRLEGAAGDDVIHGGGGNDIIFGNVGSLLGPFANPLGPQLDKLYGGDGNDIIETAPEDAGSEAYGEAGDDIIRVYNGKAWGGDGSDTLTGAGPAYALYGEGGIDHFKLLDDGFAAGGDEGDGYEVSASGARIVIFDNGASGADSITFIDHFARQGEIAHHRDGDDLVFSESGTFDYGDVIVIKDYYLGARIETFYYADHSQFFI